MPSRVKRSLACAMVFLLASSPVRAQAPDLVVFAAASLKTALDAIAKAYEGQTGKRASIAYAASSALARQIEQGAPADIFVSADRDWMDHLQSRGLVRPGTRRDLLGNRIVLVAPADRAAALALEPRALSAALEDGRLATAATESVPAGKYGKAALEQLGLWGAVSGRLAETENVRAALAFVARGEAPLGLVYDTDAAAEPRVRIVARFPAASHPPIVYPAAAVTANPEASRFLEALQSPAGAEVFRREGFEILFEPRLP